MTSTLSQDLVLKKEFLTSRDSRNGVVLSVIFPSGIQIGAGTRGFNKGIKFKSIDQQPTDTSGLLYQQNDELYFNGIKLQSGTVSGGSVAPVDAQYVVLASNSTLTNEKVLTAGANITLLSNTNTVTVSASIDPGAPVNATYIVASSNSTLTNEKVLTASSGISIFDSGSIVEITTRPYGLNKEIQFNLSGTLTASSDFTYDIVSKRLTSEKITTTSLTGSLTKLFDGTSFIVAGSNVSIVSQSNGSLLITATASGSGSSADPTDSQFILANQVLGG